MAQGAPVVRPQMVTLLITSFLLIAGFTYVIYLWQRPPSRREPEFSLPPPRNMGLFAEEALNEPPPRELTGSEAQADAAALRAELLARAEAGDKRALDDAHATTETALYDEVLDALTARAASDKSLLALVSYVARSDGALRVNRRLAEKFRENWEAGPDRNSTARMLHVAALANDAGLYQIAIETAYRLWRDRRLTGISANELRQLMEGEFWLLAPEVRSSGAGFVLKRSLAQLRRKLAAER